MENNHYKSVICECGKVCKKCEIKLKQQDNRGIVALVFFAIIIIVSAIFSK